MYVLHEDWNVCKPPIAFVFYLNKVKTILHNKFKLKGNMPECRNINLQNKYMTFEMYIKTGLLVLKTEKNRVFSIVSHCASNETRRNMKQRNAYDMKKSYVIFVSLQLSFLKITKKKSPFILVFRSTLIWNRTQTVFSILQPHTRISIRTG